MLSKKLIASLTALGAVAAGGAASAATNPTTAPATTHPPVAVVQRQAPAPKAADTAEPTGGVDADTLQQGDQTTPDAGTKTAGQDAADTNAQDGQATPDATAAAGQQSNSEQAGNDGPGGHADEPGNTNADHQATGAE